MSFAKVVGQEKAVSLLRADLRSGRVAESYLFVGPQGVGKRRSALEFVKAINCQKMSDELWGLNREFNLDDSCDSCSSCKKIDLGVFPDLFVLDFESQAKLLDLKEEEKVRQRDFKIDAIRILIQWSYLTPLEGRKKVFVIDGAESLNRESANALLKVLEESSPNCLWILLSVHSERVIPTIRSRCRKISFAPLELKKVEEIILKEMGRAGEGFLNKSKRKTNLNRSKERPLELAVASGKGSEWEWGNRGDREDRGDREGEGSERVREIAEISCGSVQLALFLLEAESVELSKIADEILQGQSVQNLLKISSRILSDNKKSNLRERAEQFLKLLSLKVAHRLRANPSSEIAEFLALILQSQEELRRNVSPQLVLDSLLLSL